MINECIERCSSHPKALAFLHSLKEDRFKVCFTNTKHHYTAGHTVTTRGEGTNSRIKGHGSLKKELLDAD
jgi:hypothetical protein